MNASAVAAAAAEATPAAVQAALVILVSVKKLINADPTPIAPRVPNVQDANAPFAKPAVI